ncbi:MAG: hypothetical protein WC737_05580 [Parcubacteria group bacterium]|jgi:hypothetical protein
MDEEKNRIEKLISSVENLADWQFRKIVMEKVNELIDAVNTANDFIDSIVVESDEEDEPASDEAENGQETAQDEAESEEATAEQTEPKNDEVEAPVASEEDKKDDAGS